MVLRQGQKEPWQSQSRMCDFSYVLISMAETLFFTVFCYNFVQIQFIKPSLAFFVSASFENPIKKATNAQTVTQFALNYIRITVNTRITLIELSQYLIRVYSVHFILEKYRFGTQK